MELRLMGQAEVDTGLDALQCPIVFTGDSSQCRRYAEEHDYQWKPVHGWLFGGYYANDNGDCLMPT